MRDGGPWRGVASALAAAWILAWPQRAPAELLDGSLRDEVSARIAARLAEQRAALQPKRGGVLGLMGYNVVPDGSTNALQLSRSSFTGSDAAPTLQLSQFGFGFTVSESFPLFLESYLGTARYDPRAYFTSGEETRRTPLRWNNLAATIGVGFDIPLAEYLYLRPIINGSLGYAASDSSLFGSFINVRRSVDISALTDQHMNV